jgi:hypothetical protein
MKRHLQPISASPSLAQSSNFQYKLEQTTVMIDQLLNAYRAQPWKAIGSGGTSTTTTTTTSTTDTTSTEL